MKIQSHMSDTPSDYQFFYSPFSLSAPMSDGNFSGDHMKKEVSTGNVLSAATRTLHTER